MPKNVLTILNIKIVIFCIDGFLFPKLLITFSYGLIIFEGLFHEDLESYDRRCLFTGKVIFITITRFQIDSLILFVWFHLKLLHKAR